MISSDCLIGDEILMNEYFNFNLLDPVSLSIHSSNHVAQFYCFVTVEETVW
jgi:hypothetical protein